MSLNPYLFFDGNCAEAFDFYKSVFGGDFMMRSTFAEAPPDLGVPEAEHGKIMHMSLPVGNSVLMGSDIVSSMETRTEPGGFAISFVPDTKSDADRVFGQLTEGGSVIMPMADTFWGAYYGMGKDRFGVQWMLNVDQSNE